MISVFLLVRDEDETGVSGTGVVAAGMEFPDGHVIMRWLVGDHKSSVCWESMHAVEKIHGHNGKTRIVRVGKLNPSMPSPKLELRDLKLGDPPLTATFKSYQNIVMQPRKKVGEFKGLDGLFKDTVFDETHVWNPMGGETWKPLSKRPNYIYSTRDASRRLLTSESLNKTCKTVVDQAIKRLDEEVLWGKTAFGGPVTFKKGIPTLAV